MKRFGGLLLITVLPFGSHFMKSCFSSLEVYFLNDPRLHFNETKYGALMSAKSIPNLFMPFFGGMFLDTHGHKEGILLFLTLTLAGGFNRPVKALEGVVDLDSNWWTMNRTNSTELGFFLVLIWQLIFTLAMWGNHFWLAMLGEVLDGLGSGTVMVAMRAIVSKVFLENELTFALGVTVAGACLSKAIAKASVAPIAETQWGYMGALWYVTFWQFLSLCAGIIYVSGLDRPSGRHHSTDGEGGGYAKLRGRGMLGALRKSTVSFWMVSILHTLFLNVYHVFANFSGHFIIQNYVVSPVEAGFMSALIPIVIVLCAPPAGLILDRYGGQIYVLLMAAIVTGVAYVLLWQDLASPVLCLVMIALCESFVPTILLSALPLTVNKSVFGAAFGMAEVLQALFTIASNVFFGYSADTTASYWQDLRGLVILCIVCLVLTAFLIFWDARYKGSELNRCRKAYSMARS